MKTVKVNASKQYDILIGEGLLDSIGAELRSRFGDAKLCIVTDDIVDALYRQRVYDSLTKEGYSVECIVIPNGEKSKNAHNLFDIINKLALMRFTRNDMLIALGGGVVGDLCGFCAATYMRGIRYVQVPTTLLAAVDSSVGGKTAVDIPAGKNLFGAFWQPALVVCDTLTLNTLSPKIYADGTAEIIKYGMICDRELFDQVAGGTWSREDVIARCVEIKRDVVNKDEFEGGVRKILNFGHTFGHSVESISNFTVTHGSAVAIGMRIVCAALSSDEVLHKLTDALKNNNLPINCPYDAKDIYTHALSDKKSTGKGIEIIAVKEIGTFEIIDAPYSSIEEIVRSGVKKCLPL